MTDAPKSLFAFLRSLMLRLKSGGGERVAPLPVNDPCSGHRRQIHSIPVPLGWSPEQAWESIKRGDLLTDPEPSWANILVLDGRFVELCDA